ncbi:MAG: YcxB family protein [Desulfobulbaceae bacterium]|jgi:hypothetical protein|nr:YcxB family protein [Desulfobulbaceae bacterium]
MRHIAILHYTDELVRSAVLSFFWRNIVSWKFIVALAVCIVSLVLLLASGDRSWIVGFVGTVVFFTVLFVAMLYSVLLRQALHKLRVLGNPISTFIVEEQSFTVTSDIGSSTLNWSAIYDIWQFERYWLLLFSKAQFITLPLGDIPEEMRAYLLERLRASRAGKGG